MPSYLDSSAIIYLVEGAQSTRERVSSLISVAEPNLGGEILTSRLSMLECRIKPLRLSQSEILKRYDDFFNDPAVILNDITGRVIELATDLRAKHGYQTADAIHLATALGAGCQRFVTGDKALANCPGLRVEIVKT